MMGNVLIQLKYSDRPPPQTMNDNQSFGRVNDICMCLCVCVCVWGGGGGGGPHAKETYRGWYL